MNLVNRIIAFAFLTAAAQAQGQNSMKFRKENSFQIADSLFVIKNWKEAKQIYEVILQDGKSNSLAWNKLGFCNHNLGNLEAAIQCYQRSLSQKPTPVLKGVVYPRLARVHFLKGEKQNAYLELDSAERFGYTNVAELDSATDYKAVRNEKQFQDFRQKIYAKVFPCMVDAHAREFDFWVGDWDVYQAGTNTLVGRNVIQIIADGCGLLENWTNLGNPVTASQSTVTTADSITTASQRFYRLAVSNL